MKVLICFTAIAFFFLTGCSSGSWDFIPTPVGGDEPAIRITQVTWDEAFGDTTQLSVKGQVYNVENPKDYKVSIWIRVSGSWYPKPTFADPYTSISENGYWKNQVMTGGHDQDADAVKVYLVRKGSSWLPGQNQAPEGDIIAEDIVYKS